MQNNCCKFTRWRLTLNSKCADPKLKLTNKQERDGHHLSSIYSSRRINNNSYAYGLRRLNANALRNGRRLLFRTFFEEVINYQILLPASCASFILILCTDYKYTSTVYPLLPLVISRKIDRAAYETGAFFCFGCWPSPVILNFFRTTHHCPFVLL